MAKAFSRMVKMRREPIAERLAEGLEAKGVPVPMKELLYLVWPAASNTMEGI
jgi:hypothetical protein